jgi:hypothetical protein
VKARDGCDAECDEVECGTENATMLEEGTKDDQIRRHDNEFDKTTNRFLLRHSSSAINRNNRQFYNVGMIKTANESNHSTPNQTRAWRRGGPKSASI